MCDSTDMGDAVPTQLIDNERVRVTEWKFKPGTHTVGIVTRWIM